MAESRNDSDSPIWYADWGSGRVPIENVNIDIPKHQNCRTDINMSTYDDLVRRHKETEELRKKMTSTYGLSSSTTSSSGNISISELDKLLLSINPNMYNYGSVQYKPIGTQSSSKKSATKKQTQKSDTKKKVDFDSVILEGSKKQLVIEAIEQLGNYQLIFEKWGFSKTLEKGKAVSMLFYGPPGTGKTMLAQAIADKLDKKLKIISSAEIESSEPGQAERNIKAFFEGTKEDTVLLFDECDSLIYDRQQVGSILAAQVNQLLSSLEKFEGVVIFTTNRLGVLDEAFNRRLSLKMEFELPKFSERIKIWQRMFPKEAPLDKNINWGILAEPEIAGGHIKNAVLRAARAAAIQKVKKGQKKKITQSILERALKLEIIEMISFMEAKEKQGKLPRQVGYTMRKG